MNTIAIEKRAVRESTCCFFCLG